MGPEDPRARGRRAAGAVGGARRGLLRQGLRHRLSRPAAHAAAASARGDRSVVARRDVRACGALSPRRRPAGLRHRRAGAGGAACWSAARMPAQAAIAWLSIVPIAESRSSYNGLLVFLFIAAVGVARGASAIHRLASRAVRRGAGLGLRLSRSEPRDAIHRRQLRAADPPRVRHAGVPRARAGRHAAARRRCARRASRRRCAIRSGTRSMRRSAAPSASPPTGSTACSSSPSAAISASSSLALVLLLLVLAIWP